MSQRSIRTDSPRRARRVGEDIPLARRSSSLPSPGTSRGSKLRWFLVGSALVASFGALLIAGPLRGLLQPAPVAGLNARLGRDGRLLGHFRYPEAPAAQLVAIAPDLQLRTDAARSLLQMQKDAAAAGVNLVVLSGFRSRELQKRLFFDVKSERNQSAADRALVSAPPGFSEHSTGFAVDLGDGRAPEANLSPRFDATTAYRWLQANAARYHFQLSFPRNNPQGVSYEPWHWRFEGSSEALELFEPAHRLSGSRAGDQGLR